MRTFQAIVGLLAMIALSAQTLRHAYVLYVEPRGSVLDQYEPTKIDIAGTTSLDELIKLYDEAYEKVKEANKEMEAQKAASSANDVKFSPSNPYDHGYRDNEPYKSETRIKAAIEEWESHNSQLHELHFFWAVGVIVSAIGAGIYLRVQRWAGLCICILGFLEMMWATYPAFAVGGSPVEFNRLLLFKLIYSTLSVLILVVGWVIASRCQTTLR